MRAPCVSQEAHPPPILKNEGGGRGGLANSMDFFSAGFPAARRLSPLRAPRHPFSLRHRIYLLGVAFLPLPPTRVLTWPPAFVRSASACSRSALATNTVGNVSNLRGSCESTLPSKYHTPTNLLTIGPNCDQSHHGAKHLMPVGGFDTNAEFQLFLANVQAS